jgi:dihydroorotate dehydrogenase
MNPQLLSQLYHLSSPAIELFPEKWQIKLASVGRIQFMQQFVNTIPEQINLPATTPVLAWGLTFRNSLMNSAGMFKNGEGYDVVSALGAGGYIGGTSTANPRLGNNKYGIKLPFITLPDSKISLNWLGLPNLGDDALAHKVITSNKVVGCPIGWSVMRSPDFNEADGLQLLINSLWKYCDNSQIDFIEINESCPNVKNGGGSIIPRLEIISREFLQKRQRKLPIIVKLSNDLSIESVKQIVCELIRLGFDGINLGNTSTSYPEIRKQICAKDKELFDYFTKQFGGGASGCVLKQRSLDLCSAAAEVISNLQPDYEFHIIRSGGIDCASDLRDSQRNGITLNQWYTGFFTVYHQHGSKVYTSIYS